MAVDTTYSKEYGVFQGNSKYNSKAYIIEVLKILSVI